MRKTSLIAVLLLLAAACGKKDGTVPGGVTLPAVRLELLSAGSTDATFLVSTVGCKLVHWSCTEELSGELQMPGAGVSSTTLEIYTLLPGTSYTLTVQGIGEQGLAGESVSQSFRTTENVLPAGLPADMTLIPGPSSHRKPLSWSKDRWYTHAVYKDEDGAEHWLFDSFLLIEGQQNGVYGSPVITYSVTDEDRPSATKAQWQQLLDFWFLGGDFLWQESYWGDGVSTYGRWYTGRTETVHYNAGQLDSLEACIREVSRRIGAPSTRRGIIMAVPEPIYFDNYIRGIGGSGRTVYWGDGLDFSSPQDRIRAVKWFMDATREAFARKNYRFLELTGFYILPEVLSTTWRAEYKRYDLLIPSMAAYAHEGGQALYWIPYNMAEGYTRWQGWGIDMAFMQPNYYWEPDAKPMAPTFQAINSYGMGLELEFEYSMVEAVNGEASARLYRSRFDDYLSWARREGVYGKRPIALYSGTDAMEQLALSTLDGDRAMYHKLGHFIIDSPLKKP